MEVHADRHFAPDGNAWIADVEASIPPHESHRFDVAFHVPSDARQLAFVTNHGSGTPCTLLPSIFIIGQGRCLSHKVRLDSPRVTPGSTDVSNVCRRQPMKIGMEPGSDSIGWFGEPRR
jgi:hypothetical protein